MTDKHADLLNQMKARSLRMGLAPKKGEVLYAGLQLLKRLSEEEFEAVIRPLLRGAKFKKSPKGNTTTSTKK